MGYNNYYTISQTISETDFYKIASLFESFLNYTNHKLNIKEYFGCKVETFHSRIYGTDLKEALIISFKDNNNELFMLPNISTYSFFQTNRTSIDLAVKILLMIANKVSKGLLTFETDEGGNNVELIQQAYQVFNSLESRIFINSTLGNHLFFNIILPYLDGPLNKNFSFK